MKLKINIFFRSHCYILNCQGDIHILLGQKIDLKTAYLIIHRQDVLAFLRGVNDGVEGGNLMYFFKL